MKQAYEARIAALVLSADIDRLCRGSRKAALASDNPLAVEEAHLQTRVLPTVRSGSITWCCSVRTAVTNTGTPPRAGNRRAAEADFSRR